MSTIKDGGSAFPTQFQEHNGEAIQYVSSGMTLRDYFAAKAMAAICAHPDTWGLTIEEIIVKSYEIADAMLRARGDTVIPLKEATHADYLAGALQEIADSARLDCGCVPCRGACYSKDDLRDLVISHRKTAIAAVKKYEGAA